MKRGRKSSESTFTENGKKIWKCGKYKRLSKEDGHDVSYSIENQDAILNHFLASHPEIQVVDDYQDDGRSGTDSDREDFQRLLADIYAKRINCVIVKDLSRLSRNDYECGHYLEYVFVSLDVRFISVELPALDSFLRPQEISSIATKMQSFMNDQHCYQTPIKIRSVLDMKRSEGQFIGAFAPYGYLKDPDDRHKLTINPETAPVVQDIFRWYVYEGMSKNAICRKLIALGIPSPTAYKQQKGMKYHNPHAETGKVFWSHHTIENLQAEQTVVSNGITSADPYLQAFLKYQNIDHLERGIVVALIKSINIYEGKKIEVEFNFADQHQRILDFIEANQVKLTVVKHEAV